MSGTLVVRTDASAAIGSGHLMRCLALGQAWQESGGRVVSITTSISEWLLQCLLKEGFAVHQLERAHPDDQDWYLTERLLAVHPGAWLVLDGYHFDSDYQRKVKEAGYRLVVIDDMAHLSHYYADIILNQNLHGQYLRYSREPSTRMCLGTSFVLLRRDFLKWRGWKRKISEVASNILITLGSSDPDNVTLKVVEALQQVEVAGLEAVAVVGPGNPHYQQLQSAVRDSRIPIRVEKHVKNMPALMAWADAAISAGGSSVWELAFMGVPVIGLSRGRQEEILLDASTQFGVTIALRGSYSLDVKDLSRVLADLVHDRERRAVMSDSGRVLVDGLGSARAVSVIAENSLQWNGRERKS